MRLDKSFVLSCSFIIKHKS